MVVFVATEATLFGTLIGSYYDLRFATPRWPPPGVPDPKLLLPLVLLAVLVSTSVPVQLAARFGNRGRVGPAQLALVVAIAAQSGTHHAHVLVGILLEAWLLLRQLGGTTRYRVVGLQATAFYWHAVNVLAVAVTIVQLSPSL
jgi:heme/copper-type cytochrome/quinol oxidase subunit 3